MSASLAHIGGGTIGSGEQPTDPGEDSRSRRPGFVKLLLSAAAVLVAVAMVSVTSLALFTDTATVTGNTFSTGTIDITATPASAVVTMPAMAPGDQVTAPLTVGNAGSLEFRYAIESTTTEDVLASELVMTIKTGATCDDANWATTGVAVYAGRLGSVATDAVVGSSATGGDVGDRVLAAGASEVLCVNVTLPVAATAGAGLTTTATLDFVAEQTANNP